jgi:hypothetical protein
MKFAMIVDGCVQHSYFVKDKRSYRLKADNLEPYGHHHSIKNECHLGIWGWPFVFGDGYFINWTEWETLPNLDLDIIMVALEKHPGKYNVKMLRDAYPNATIVSFIKEDYWTRYNLHQRLEFFNQCDYITFPWNIKYDNDPNGILGFATLEKLVNKKVHYIPQPHNIEYLYDNYYNENKNLQILNYKTPEISEGEKTGDFVNYISKKYNIETTQHIVKYKGPEHKQWEEFLEGITTSGYCFNLDTVRSGGSMAVQCAALGILNIGGVQDSHEILFPNTATNDWNKLEKIFDLYCNDVNKHYEDIQFAYNKAMEIYSYQSIKNKFNKMLLK